MIVAATWLACAGDAPAPPHTPAVAPPAAPAPVAAPVVDFHPPARTSGSPAAARSTKDVDRVRERLIGVIRAHGREPVDGWVVVHTMLALGADEPLTNGQNPVDWLFASFAEVDVVGGEDLLTFPHDHAGALVEPHTDLVLKALTEGGVAPERIVRLGDGRTFPVSSLYRHSLQRAWVAGKNTGFQNSGYNDTPWALQGLAAWAPEHLEWTATGARKMSLDGFTTAVLDQVEADSRALAKAQAEGRIAKKDGQGIFSYTCGGAHMVMGTSYAVARGFGAPSDKARVCALKDLWRYRIDVELDAIDPSIASLTDRGMVTLLLVQRLKFLGHWLEATHKILAMGLCEPSGDDEAATKRVLEELVRTVDGLDHMGAIDAMPTMRTDPVYAKVPRGAEQLWRDVLGDSAHALRGLDLATGRATVAY